MGTKIDKAEKEAERFTKRFFLKQILWMNKFTLLILLTIAPLYFITGNQVFLDSLVIIGLIFIAFGAMMGQGYSSPNSGGLPPSYIKKDYDRTIIWAAKLRYINTGVLYVVKGIFLLVIGAIITLYFS